METVFTDITDYLLKQSWQIAILFAVVAIVCLAVRKKSAHLRYLLWLLIIAKCLVPSLITVSLAILPQKPLLQPLPESAPIREFAPPPESVILSEAKNLNPPVPLAVRQGSIMSQLAQIRPKTWFCGIWLGGVGLFLVIVLIKAARFNHRLKGQRKLLTAGMQKEIDELLDRFGVHAKLHIWLLDGIGQPFVWGLLRGSIYLPANFGQIGSREHRRGILMHEIAHVVRFDAAVNCLQAIAQAIFWFHPLVWLANRNIRAEREKCCDETAIARLSAAPKVYSSAIVDTLIAEYQSTQPIPSLAIAGPIKNIEDRIKTIMKPGKKFYNRPTIIAIVTILLLAIAAVPTTIALTHRQPEKPEEFFSKAALEYTSTLPNGVKVELVGVCEYPSKDKEWWRPDGSRLDTKVITKDYSGYTSEDPAYEMAFKFSGQDFSFRIKDIKGSKQHSGLEVIEPEEISAFRIHIKSRLSKTSMKVGVAAGEWKTVGTHTGGGTTFKTIKRFLSRKKIIFSAANETKEGVVMTVSDDLDRGKETALFAVDENGAEYKGETQASLFVNNMQQQTFVFGDVLLEDIKEFQFRTRPFEWVKFKNVALRPNKKPDVQVDGENMLFGRQIEVTVPVSRDAEGKSFDFDSGKVISHPPSLHAKDKDVASKWVIDTGVDIALVEERTGPRLWGFGCVFAELLPEHWETFTPKELLVVLSTYALTGQFNIIKQLLPRTFAFKTREGRIGILQIHGLTDKPGGIKIRYKTLQQKPDVQVEVKPEPEARTDLSERRTASVASDYKATLPNGVTVELVGACEHPSQGKKWWLPDGNPTDLVPYDKIENPYLKHIFARPDSQRLRREFAVRLSGVDETGHNIRFHVMQNRGALLELKPLKNGVPAEGLRAIAASIPIEDNSVRVEIGVADGPFKTFSSGSPDFDNSFSRLEGQFDGRGSFTNIREIDGKTTLTVADNFIDYDPRVVAVDKSGTIHLPDNMAPMKISGVRITTVEFNGLSLESIKEFQLQRRPYEWAIFKNVALRPNQKHDVRVEDVINIATANFGQIQDIEFTGKIRDFSENSDVISKEQLITTMWHAENKWEKQILVTPDKSQDSHKHVAIHSWDGDNYKATVATLNASGETLHKEGNIINTRPNLGQNDALSAMAIKGGESDYLSFLKRPNVVIEGSTKIEGHDVLILKIDLQDTPEGKESYLYFKFYIDMSRGALPVKVEFYPNMKLATTSKCIEFTEIKKGLFLPTKVLVYFGEELSNAQKRELAIDVKSIKLNQGLSKEDFGIEFEHNLPVWDQNIDRAYYHKVGFEGTDSSINVADKSDEPLDARSQEALKMVREFISALKAQKYEIASTYLLSESEQADEWPASDAIKDLHLLNKIKDFKNVTIPDRELTVVMGDWESGVREAFLVSSDFISNDGETGKLLFILDNMAACRPDAYESGHWAIQHIGLTKFKLKMPPDLQEESDKLVSNIQQLIPYINSYAKDHEGDLPDELNLLEDYGLDGYELFGGPVWWHKVPYRGKGKNRNLADPSRIIVAHCVVSKRCGFYDWPILFLDGHIETRTKLNLQDLEEGLKEISKKPDVQVEDEPVPEARTELSDMRNPSVASDYKATLANGVTVELVGVCEHPSDGKQWWKPGGNMLTEVPYKWRFRKLQEEVEFKGYEFVVRVDGADDVGIRWNIPEEGPSISAGFPINKSGERIGDKAALGVQIDKKLATTSVSVGITTGEWETKAAHDGKKITNRECDSGSIVFSEAYGSDDGATITISDNLTDLTCRVIAIDSVGNMHTGTRRNSPVHFSSKSPGYSEGIRQTTTSFSELKIKQVKEFQFQTRPYEWAKFKNVALRPNQKTDVQVEGQYAQMKARAESAEKLKELGLALYIYASERDNEFPQSLEQLEIYDIDEELAWARENAEYLGMDKVVPGDEVQPVPLAFDKTMLKEGEGTNVVFSDGHVGFVEPARLIYLGIDSGTDENRTRILVEGRFILVPQDSQELKDFFEQEDIELPTEEENSITAPAGSEEIEKFLEEQESVEADIEPERTRFLDPEQVNKLLRLIQTIPESKVLTSPKVLVFDGESAVLSIMQQEMYISGYEESDSTSEPEPITETIDKGIKFEVLPKITNDHNIKLDLDVELAGFAERQERLYKGRYPYEIIATEVFKIVSQVMMPDGKTVLMAGKIISSAILDRDDDSGADKTTKELLILITPTINPEPD